MPNFSWIHARTCTHTVYIHAGSMFMFSLLKNPFSNRIKCSTIHIDLQIYFPLLCQNKFHNCSKEPDNLPGHDTLYKQQSRVKDAKFEAIMRESSLSLHAVMKESDIVPPHHLAPHHDAVHGVHIKTQYIWGT